MTVDYCTLFDSHYLSRGLALYRSLVETHESFTLRVYCMDDVAKQELDARALPHVTAISVSELEHHDADLAAVKPTRTAAEYCWTATPAVCLHALAEESDVTAITYLDADLRFQRDATPLVEGLADDSVLITPHRYAPEHAHHAVNMGVYNVQFVTFRRTEDGLRVLRWWHDRCIEWCYARVEDGKFGDQRYLDDWPDRFPGIRVTDHPGVGVAPWNVSQHVLGGTVDRPTVDGVGSFFYHHHSLRLFEPGAGRPLMGRALGLQITETPAGDVVWTHAYPLAPRERELFWDPYVRDVVETGAGGYEPILDAPRIRGRALRARASRRLRRFRSDAGMATTSWDDPSVAAQMRALTEAQLRAPERTRPFLVFREIIAWLRSEGSLPEPARLLDVGCGMAPYADLLDRWAPGAFSYEGADYAREVLAAAKLRRPDLRLRQIDLLRDALPTGFDVLFASALVDVLPRWQEALDRLLASDARYVVLHRQRIGKNSRVRRVAGYEGQRTFASTINADELEALARSSGRIVVKSWFVQGAIHSFALERPLGAD